MTALYISDDAQRVYDHFIRTASHVGDAAYDLAEEIVLLNDALRDAERRLGIAHNVVSAGYVRRRPPQPSKPKALPEAL